jgi:bifunctional non-homologous end joining protein LigD
LNDRLDAYRTRRNFGTTPEPEGDEGPTIRPSDHLRFVVQKHDATRLHYDLRLELDGVFKSWAVTRGPSLDPGEKRLAVEVEDHPLEYGDFEGTIPQGEYGGGTVMIWDRGYWAPESSEPPEQSLADGELKFALAGSKLSGSWVLVRLKPRHGEKRNNWLLIKHRDSWATPGKDAIQKKDRSAASGRSMAQIAAGKGKAPTDFMTAGNAIDAGAVWDSHAKTQSQQREVTRRMSTGPDIDVEMPRLTHPDRVLWPEPETTKHDLARYLVAAAPWMIHHVYGRPCSLVRAPDGIGGQTFFQRHPMRGQPGGIQSVMAGDDQPYLQIEGAQGIANMAQISVVEFHPWNSSPFAPKVPGRLVFDLDPAPDVDFDAVIAAAKELRERLERLDLVAFCKTTGGKGLHVVVPLTSDPDLTWPQAKLFAETVCAQAASDKPRQYVTNMSKQARRGRIFLDYLRNDATATAVAPLSPRARAGAPVSMPLNWRQVRSGLDPKRYTMKSALSLLAKSKAWFDYFEAQRPLKPAIVKLVGRKS